MLTDVDSQAMTFYLVFHWHEEYCRFLVPSVVIVRITSHPLYCDLTYENEDFGKRDSEADEKKPLHAEENNTLHPSWRGDILFGKSKLNSNFSQHTCRSGGIFKTKTERGPSKCTY